MRDEFECSVVQDFIDDHSDLALLYAIKQEKGDCDEMCEFTQISAVFPHESITG